MKGGSALKLERLYVVESVIMVGLVAIDFWFLNTSYSAVIERG